MFSYLNNLLIWVWNNVIVQHFFRNVLSLRRLRHDLTKLSATKRAYDALLASKMGFYAHYSILLHNQRDMVIIFYPATSKSEIFFKKYSVHMHPRLEAILLPLVPMTLSVTCRTPTVLSLPNTVRKPNEDIHSCRSPWHDSWYCQAMTLLTSHSLSPEIFERISWFVKGNRGLPAGDLVFDTNK